MNFISFLLCNLFILKVKIKNKSLILILLTRRIWWTPNNANSWQKGFNSAFVGLHFNEVIFCIIQPEIFSRRSHIRLITGVVSCYSVVSRDIHVWPGLKCSYLMSHIIYHYQLNGNITALCHFGYHCSLFLLCAFTFHNTRFRKVELERKVWNITNSNLLTKVVRLDYHILKSTGNPAVCEHFSLI